MLVDVPKDSIPAFCRKIKEVFHSGKLLASDLVRPGGLCIPCVQNPLHIIVTSFGQFQQTVDPSYSCWSCADLAFDKHTKIVEPQWEQVHHLPNQSLSLPHKIETCTNICPSDNSSLRVGSSTWTQQIDCKLCCSKG